MEKNNFHRNRETDQSRDSFLGCAAALFLLWPSGCTITPIHPSVEQHYVCFKEQGYLNGHREHQICHCWRAAHSFTQPQRELQQTAAPLLLNLLNALSADSDTLIKKDVDINP